MASKRERRNKKIRSRIKHAQHIDNKNGSNKIQRLSKDMIKALDISEINKLDKDIQRAYETAYEDLDNAINKYIIHQYELIVNDLQPYNKMYKTIRLDNSAPVENNLSKVDMYKEINTELSINIDDFNKIEYIDYLDYQALIDYWQEEYNVDLTRHTGWSMSQLVILDEEIKALKADFGLGTNNQYEKNYQAAGERIGDEGKAEDDLNKIIDDEMTQTVNNGQSCYRLIEAEFNYVAAEKFYASDQVRQQEALNYIGVTPANTTPAERRRMNEL